MSVGTRGGIHKPRWHLWDFMEHMSNRCCSLYPTKRSHNTVIPSSLSPVLCYTRRPVPLWVVGWKGWDAHPLINVLMSPGKQANEKSLSQAHPNPNRVSGGATSYEIKLITPPCEGVINNPRAPNIAPPELTDWGAFHQPQRDLSLWTDSSATITEQETRYIRVRASSSAVFVSHSDPIEMAQHILLCSSLWIVASWNCNKRSSRQWYGVSY